MSSAPVVNDPRCGEATMRRMALAAVAVSICGNVFAARTLEPIESAYELRLIHVVWPASTLGSLIVKPCPACDEVKRRSR